MHYAGDRRAVFGWSKVLQTDTFRPIPRQAFFRTVFHELFLFDFAFIGNTESGNQLNVTVPSEISDPIQFETPTSKNITTIY